ncbi:TolB family protein [Oculatella sp. LEGE 06141]|nr:TolB family protein [Oculatella sp. LEGE 06141]
MSRELGSSNQRLRPINSRTYRPLSLAVVFCGLIILSACQPSSEPIVRSSGTLNSRYNDEQPSLSGDGRFMAYVSNRNGGRDILLYDLRQQQFIELPRLNRGDAVAESPSISNTARYIVYVASDRARPEIQLYDRVTGQIQGLTVGYRGWVRNPSISPNGRYITFETGQQGQWDVEVIDRGSRIELDLPDRN